MRWIQSLFFVLCMVLLSGWMQNISKKRTSVRGGDTDTYVMEVPSFLTKACVWMLVAGLVLFTGFAILFYKQLGDVTIGHLNFAIVFAMIGFLGFVACCRWKIVVQKSEITFYNVFKGSRKISVEQIEKAVRGSKGELEIYVQGKKIKTIDRFATNFESFYDMLEDHKIEIDVR